MAADVQTSAPVPRFPSMTYPRILALGDSLTAGYCLPSRQSFAVPLEALLRER